MEMTYLTQPPKRYTFEQPKLRRWVEGHVEGEALNLFAGRTRLDVNEYRVDIDPEMPADWHGDAAEFLEGFEVLPFQTVIFDPPYNIRKAREKYGDRWIGKGTKLKNLIATKLPIGGVFISLGYDSVGMSKSRGFVKEALCVVCHGGDHNDTLCLVERKV
jgi:hypothetical protein